MKYDEGDIVVSKIAFADSNKTATRTLVIVDKDQAVQVYDAVNMSKQSSQAKYSNTILIEKNEMNNLRENSWIKTNAIYEINDQTAYKKIGQVDEATLERARSLIEKQQELGLLVRQPLSVQLEARNQGRTRSVERER
jgi:hypothetical protein